MKYELDKVKEEGFKLGYKIGKTIKMLRKKINLTQDDLATSTGLSVQAIVNIETASAIATVPTLFLFANAFNISLSELIFICETTEV